MLKLESRSGWAAASGLEPTAGWRKRHVPGTLRPQFTLWPLWKSGEDLEPRLSVSIRVELAAHLDHARAQSEHDPFADDVATTNLAPSSSRMAY